MNSRAYWTCRLSYGESAFLRKELHAGMVGVALQLSAGQQANAVQGGDVLDVLQQNDLTRQGPTPPVGSFRSVLKEVRKVKQSNKANRPPADSALLQTAQAGTP